jgi:hypothetical protein
MNDENQVWVVLWNDTLMFAEGLSVDSAINGVFRTLDSAKAKVVELLKDDDDDDSDDDTFDGDDSDYDFDGDDSDDDDENEDYTFETEDDGTVMVISPLGELIYCIVPQTID